MEVVYFTLVAIVLYLASDRILDWIERTVGKRFEYRPIIFFGILASLSIISFWLLRFVTG